MNRRFLEMACVEAAIAGLAVIPHYASDLKGAHSQGTLS